MKRGPVKEEILIPCVMQVHDFLLSAALLIEITHLSVTHAEVSYAHFKWLFTVNAHQFYCM